MVLTGSGIYSNGISFVDEERYTNFYTYIEFSGFRSVRCCIAAYTGFGLNNGEFHVLRKVATHRLIIFSIEHHDALHAFFQELRGVNHDLRDGDLFVVIQVHEVVAVVFVKELIFACFDANNINGDTTVEGFVNDFTVVEVLDFGAHERRAFAGLYMEEFHYAPDVRVHAEAQAIRDVSGCCCHDD